MSSLDGDVTPRSALINGHDNKTPFIIGVAGGTASGKSTVCSRIMEKLGQDNVVNRERRVVCISQDSFYRQLTNEERSLAFKGNFDFDHPTAFDDELLLSTLQDILKGKVVEVPNYNFKEHLVEDSAQKVYPADVVLVEGILLFYFPEIRDLFHMKLFVDTDSDTRLSRRVLRDVKERNRDLETVLNQYTKFVKPAFEEFCQPTKKYADVIIPRGADNGVAVKLIVTHIERHLKQTLFQTAHQESITETSFNVQFNAAKSRRDESPTKSRRDGSTTKSRRDESPITLIARASR